TDSTTDEGVPMSLSLTLGLTGTDTHQQSDDVTTFCHRLTTSGSPDVQLSALTELTELSNTVPGVFLPKMGELVRFRYGSIRQLDFLW
ncbi:hypothetical protein KIPB_014671, partial [Kipferlia bialata]